ncbi:dITP/XTP pyrophosphatase [Gammaproteobacteria bacterium]
MQHPHEIVLASGNPGKIREVSQILARPGITIWPQSQFKIQEVEETGISFIENALIKARHAAAHSGLPAIADDSGLAVDALEGAPGVWSARYAGPGASDAANLEKLLRDMEQVPPEERTAQFICVLVYMRHPRDPTPIVCEGIWEGHLTYAPVGNNGFGYDPIFFVPGHGCTSAQLAPEVKNQLSHRGQALRLFIAALQARRSASWIASDRVDVSHCEV